MARFNVNPYLHAIMSNKIEEFQNWLDQFDYFPSSLDEEGMILTGQLWSCSDTLPSYYCDQLDIQKGSSYACACREIRKALA